MEISFINFLMACTVCDVLNIESIKLSKPKLIKAFDSQSALNITYAIYFIFTVQEYWKTVASMLITKLNQYLIIFGKLWIKKHGVILNMSCNALIF